MAETYPYMVSNNKISSIIHKIRGAAKPSKFTFEFLKKLGFNSSNDRAVMPLLKRLGFMTEDGSPTQYYDRLKGDVTYDFILGERIRELYSDLFSVNENIYKADDAEIKSAFSRVTGKDTKTVDRYYATFKMLCSLAKFSAPLPKKEEIIQANKRLTQDNIQEKSLGASVSEFHYNIQIHLPATTDVSVYNAIFKSMKDNLII